MPFLWIIFAICELSLYSYFQCIFFFFCQRTHQIRDASYTIHFYLIVYLSWLSIYKNAHIPNEKGKKFTESVNIYMLFCCFTSSECIKSNLIRIYSKKFNLILTCLHTKNRMEQLETKS